MNKISSQLLQTLAESSAAHPALAAAAASGLIGGGLTMGTKRRHGETPGQRRLRILRNALLAAGAGGGAVALGQKAMENFNTALPVGDEDPVARKFTSPIGRGVTGALGLIGAHSIFGPKKEQLAAAAQELKAVSGVRPKDLPEAARALYQQKGVTHGLMNSPSGSKIYAGVEKALEGSGKNTPLLDDLLKRFYLGSADREFFSAGLPTAVHEHAGRFGAGPGRTIARYAHNLFGLGSRYAGTGRPLLRTALGLGLGVALPELTGLATKGIKSYALGAQ